MSPRPAKAHAQEALADSILNIGWTQITQGGIDALNLRAIGRSLGITAPAIYHYYPDRIALIQALRQQHIVTGTAQLALIWQKHGAQRAHIGVHALCHEYRRWATAQPQRYLVVFGYDPDYATPPAWMIALLIPFVQACETLRQQQQMRMRTNLILTTQGQAQLAAWHAVAGHVDATAVATAVVIWSRLHGLMYTELSQMTPAFGVTWSDLFRFELNAMMRELFYAPQTSTIQE